MVVLKKKFGINAINRSKWLQFAKQHFNKTKKY